MDSSGHRGRLRQKFLEGGTKALSESQILEMMLYYCIPRKDTYPIARELLSRYGAIDLVLQAPQKALEDVDGVGESVAMYLHFLGAVYEDCFQHRCQETALNTVEKYGDYMWSFFKGLRREGFCILSLDGEYRPKSCELIELGDTRSVCVSPQEILTYAQKRGARNLVVGHNHPDSLALPSQEDLHNTEILIETLREADIRLVDHLIFTEDDYVSLFQSGAAKKR